MDDVDGHNMIEVLREGEPTIDGRFIDYGAIIIPDGPVPLFDFDGHDGESDVAASGALFNFERRDDNRIYCDTTLEHDDDRTVTVSVAIDEREEIGGESISIKSCRIIGGVVSSTMKYPWA